MAKLVGNGSVPILVTSLWYGEWLPGVLVPPDIFPDNKSTRHAQLQIIHIGWRGGHFWGWGVVNQR